MLVHKIRKILIQVRKRACVYFEAGGADWFRKQILLTLQLTTFKTLTKLFAGWLTYLLSCSKVTTPKFYCGFEHLPSSLQTNFTFLIWSSELIKIDDRGLPWWRSGWESACQCRDTGSSPGLGRSHMPWSDWAREPQLLRLRVWSLCSATREAAIVRGLRTAMKSGPHLPQLEKALAQKRRPNTAIIKKKKNRRQE